MKDYKDDPGPGRTGVEEQGSRDESGRGPVPYDCLRHPLLLEDSVLPPTEVAVAGPGDALSGVFAWENFRTNLIRLRKTPPTIKEGQNDPSRTVRLKVRRKLGLDKRWVIGQSPF